jgi:excisionase family DNA binding protein
MNGGPENNTSGINQARTDDSPLMTVRELGDYLNITMSTVYKMVSRGEIPVVRLGPNGRTLRFRREQIKAWLTDHQVDRATAILNN